MSPGFEARAEGIFSAAAITATTFILGPTSAMVCRVPKTVAAPHMS